MLADTPVYPVLPVADLERAKRFYKEKLGLRVLNDAIPGVVVFVAGKGTQLELYEHGATKADNTTCSFSVLDIVSTVRWLKERGVVFEEYDFYDFKTVDSIAVLGGNQAAWFKDTEGNIICIHQEG